MDRNKVVLVDDNDRVLGEMDKLAAHQQGKLHRAFSIFVFNEKGALLLQQRAQHKYHGGGLWTNTCCSHPQLDEDVASAATERLRYEMGISCELHFSHTFIYQSKVENNLIEYEYDYVFWGYSSAMPHINLDEVQDYKWMELDAIYADLKENPDKYTYWFRIALPMVIKNSMVKSS